MGKFDVFISFKNTDSDGKFTRDREMAEKLFVALKEKNINAFYSNVSIAERGESHFGKMINEALDECDIFVAVGSSVEYLQSQWVKYEIETFNNELLNGNKTLEKSAMYSYVTTDVRTNKLPMELRRCQSFTDLDAIVSSICKRINNQQEVKQAFAVPQDVNAPRKIQIGSIVDGKYEVLKQIGRGGMCTVYLAINKSANKQWAIKVVEDDGRGAFETKISSFVFEAEILRKMDSPYFPRVVDVIREYDAFMIVMDYIEGDSLENILNECGSQPEKMVKEWAKELCYALQTLHTRRPAIIYRDMKPANIMITPFGG
ncbi:MAG: protein kinase, partial [Clostridia bacterium]|nr:protein kinase [Clostridia bacterium]